MKIALVYGSVRDARQGIKGALFLKNKLAERGIDVEFIDAKEYDFPLLNKMYKEYEQGSAPDYMESVASKLRASEGFLIVTGEYNHSIPPALKNLLDHFQKEYFFKPSAIASYSAGSFGGVRAAVHLRSVLGELGMPSIASMFPMLKVHKNFDENGNALDEFYDKSVKKFLDEFIWYVEALSAKREGGTPY